MARRLRLTAKAIATATGFFYLTETGRQLLGMLQNDDEPDRVYLRRINRLKIGAEPDFLDNIGVSGIRDKRTKNSDTVEELRREIRQSLDGFASAWIDLGEKFLAAAEDADPEQLEALAAQNAPVNYRDPRTFATALHYVAAQGARPAFRALLKIGKCDFLLRDKWGRLASEMAGVYGRDLVMERLLQTKEIRQARETGIPLDQIFRRSGATSRPLQNWP
jgi:ankyrin repeat protein